MRKGGFLKRKSPLTPKEFDRKFFVFSLQGFEVYVLNFDLSRCLNMPFIIRLPPVRERSQATVELAPEATEGERATIL